MGDASVSLRENEYRITPINQNAITQHKKKKKPPLGFKRIIELAVSVNNQTLEIREKVLAGIPRVAIASTNFSALHRFGSHERSLVQSNPVVSHREEVTAISEEFPRENFQFSPFRLPQDESHSDSRNSDPQSVLLFLSCHVSVITTAAITTMSISFHRPRTPSLRNRDFPRPFVTLGISCRGSHGAKPRMNCLDPIQVSFYVFFFLRRNANGFDAASDADNNFA